MERARRGYPRFCRRSGFRRHLCRYGDLFKGENPAVKTVIVEPEGSILNGGEPHAHKTEGIGMEFIPDYMDENHFDAIYTVEDDTAFSLVREAAEKEGLLIGSSSGAALYARA